MNCPVKSLTSNVLRNVQSQVIFYTSIVRQHTRKRTIHKDKWKCTCGVKGRPESEIDIGLIVPLDLVGGHTLVGQLDQLVREEPIVWKCA